MVFVFVLQPDDKPTTDNKPSTITRKVEDVAQGSLEKGNDPADHTEEGKEVEAKEAVTSNLEGSTATTEDFTGEDPESDKAAGVVMETPSDNPFDMSDVPDFPPLPPLEDDEGPSFGDLDLNGGLDEGSDLSGWKKLPLEGEPATPSETEEF
jgi:hypothetical protein